LSSVFLIFFEYFSVFELLQTFAALFTKNKAAFKKSKAAQYT